MKNFFGEKNIRFLCLLTVSVGGVTPGVVIPPAIAQSAQQSEIDPVVIEAVRRPGLPAPQVSKITVEGPYARGLLVNGGCRWDGGACE